MKLPSLIRCSSRMDGDRCDMVRGHPGPHLARRGTTTHSWGRFAERLHTYETTRPWVTYLYLTTDRRTRVTGRSRLRAECLVCGRRETLKIRIPRIGPVPTPASGRHPERERFLADHAHPDRGHPMSWARPLANLAAHSGGLDLDLFAMRLDADLNDDPAAGTETAREEHE